MSFIMRRISVIIHNYQIYKNKMGNQICTQCDGPAPISDTPINLHHDAPDRNFAYPQKVSYEIPCEVNHILVDQLPIDRYSDQNEDNNDQRDKVYLKGTKLQQSFFLIPYSVYYTGQWLDGRPHGLGEVVFSSGSVLNAVFDKGTVMGNDSLYVMQNGSYYRGSIKNNKFNGKGVFKETNGHIYEGQWENNVPSGKGREQFQNGDKYVGLYANGKKYGDNGIYYWKNHKNYEKYQGSFGDNYFLGHGKMSLRDGTKITGLFRNNKISKGHLKNDDYEYQGDLENGKLEGEGKIKFLKKNQVYQGFFKNGQMHGYGTLINQKGNKKVGKWFMGTHLREEKNLEDEELQQLINTVNKTFSDHKYFQQGLEDLAQKLAQWSKKVNKKYEVKQIKDSEVNKINQSKYCVLEINDNLIHIFA